MFIRSLHIQWEIFYRVRVSVHNEEKQTTKIMFYSLLIINFLFGHHCVCVCVCAHACVCVCVCDCRLDCCPTSTDLFGLHGAFNNVTEKHRREGGERDRERGGGSAWQWCGVTGGTKAASAPSG